jgi:regulator of cell morphogenesis and NO signaling
MYLPCIFGCGRLAPVTTNTHHPSVLAAIAPETTVGELVRAVPARARIFENLGIDYCCGGKIPLVEICEKKGLDAATVVAMLEALDGACETPSVNPDTMGLAELCDHIERLHHDWLREELPRLDFMTRKVAAVHGDHEPRLHEIRSVFESFQSEITSHTQEEEGQVFPAIRRLESANGEQAEAVAALKPTFDKLVSEHEKAGVALAQFSTLTDRYTPPEWACNTFRAMFDALDNLEKNMHQHVHKENNVLFPRALALAKAS